MSDFFERLNRWLVRNDAPEPYHLERFERVCGQYQVTGQWTLYDEETP